MRRDHPLFLIASVTLLCASAWALADPPPAWWSDTTNGTAIISANATANNYGVLNLGQLKNTAVQAKKYLDQHLAIAGGAGPDIDALVANFTTNTTTNFAPATIGQLDYVAKPFYDRLDFLGYDTKSHLKAHGYTDAFWVDGNIVDGPPYYPWHPLPSPGDGNYTAKVQERLSLVNLGQLKMAFSFDLTNFTAANDNIFGFYTWANSFGLDIYDHNLRNETYSVGNVGDGVTYWNKYRADVQPTTYVYNGTPAANLTLNITTNGTATASANANITPIVVHANYFGANLSYAPLHYTVLPGDGHVVIGGSNSTSGTINTNANGDISLSYVMGNSSPRQWIHFTAPGTNSYVDAVYTLTSNGSGSSGSNGTVSPGIVGNGTLANITFDDPSTGTPYNLAVNAYDSGNIANLTLSWTSGAYSPNVTYQVQRAISITGNTGDWSAIGNVSSHSGNSSYTFDDAVYGGNRYFYKIVAYDGDTLLWESNIDTYTVPFVQSLDYFGHYHYHAYAYNGGADTISDIDDGIWSHFTGPYYPAPDYNYIESAASYSTTTVNSSIVPNVVAYSVQECAATLTPLAGNISLKTYTLKTVYDSTSSFSVSSQTIGAAASGSYQSVSFGNLDTSDLTASSYESKKLFLAPEPVVYDQFGRVGQNELSGNIQTTDANPVSFHPNLLNSTYSPVDHVVISWTGGNAAALELFGPTDDDGTYGQLSNGQEIYNNNEPFTNTEQEIDTDVSAASPGSVFNITIEYYSRGNYSLGNQTIHLQKAYPESELSVSSEEAAGAEYRKVALNGRPLPDGKPQTASESDQQEEETFVDALTLGLRHSVSDVYEKIPSTDLSLTVNRVYNEEIWASRHGLRPHERPDEPFGPGWRSNVVASTRWESTSDSDFPNVYVTDENGNEFHFLAVWNVSGNLYDFVPYPTGKHEKKPYEATLTMPALGTGETINNTTLTLTKKFGTQVTYEHAALDLTDAPADRVSGDTTTFSDTYFRAKTVVGRGGVGNLTYTYPANDTLVPESIKGIASGNTGLTGNLEIYIQQDTSRHITDVWDSDHNHTHYSYTSTADPTSSGNFSTLTTVTDPMNVTCNYTYEVVTEEGEQTTRNTRNGFFCHLNLTDIEDQNHNTYHFTYHLHYEDGFSGHDVGFRDFSTYLNDYYNVPGRPRMVGNISVSQGNTTINLGQFQTDSLVKVIAGPAVSNDTIRRTLVTDADGHVTDYQWGNATVMRQDIPGVIADQSPNSLGELVAWGNLTIKYYANISEVGNTSLGQESFTFDPSAGMALASVTDFSGQTTNYTHDDALPTLPAAYTNMLPGVYDVSSGGLIGNYSDPTSQTRNGTVAGNSTTLTKAFQYNAMRLMKEITDEAGNTTHYWFDGHDDDGNLTLGLRTKELHYAGNVTSGTLEAETDFAYGNSTFPGFLTKKTVVQLTENVTPAGPGNLVVEYTPDDHGRVAAVHVAPDDGLDLTTTYTYSEGGDKLSETDPNGQTTYFNYDARHRLTSVLYPGNVTRSYVYDGRGNVLRETDENGHSTYKKYDLLNRLIAEVHDMDGSNSLSGSGDTPLITAYTYSATGARLSMTPPNGNSLSGNLGNYSYSVTSNSSYTTTFVYDDLNRLIEMDTPEVDYGAEGGGQAEAAFTDHLVTQYFYNGTNPGGSAFDSSSFKPTMTIDPRGYETVIAYDERYLPVSESVQYNQAYGNFAAAYAITHKQYDAVGNLITLLVGVDGGATPGNLSGNVQTTSHTYDALNRPTVTTFADNTTASTLYHSTGLAYMKIDELGRHTATVYDAAGRPIEVHAPDPVTGNYSSNYSVTTTTYDNNSNVVRVTNPLGQSWNYLYDVRNRKVAEIQPPVMDWAEDAGNGSYINPTIRTAYDAAGNPTAVTDARGNTTVTYYDAANRPTFVFTPSVPYISGNTLGSHYLVTAHKYDQNGNILEVQQGTASSQSPGSANLTRTSATNTYDVLNRLITTTDAVGATVKNFYDEVGNRIVTGYWVSNFDDGFGDPLQPNFVGNAPFYFTYDGLNRVVHTTIPGSNLGWFELRTYNALVQTARSLTGPSTYTYGGNYTYYLGRNTEWTTPNTVTSYTYDARNRLTGVAYPSRSDLATDSYTAPLTSTFPTSRNYTYDAAGQLLAVKTAMWGGDRVINWYWFLSGNTGSGRDNVTNVALAYDKMGRLVREMQGVAINGTVTANGTGTPDGVTGGFANTYAYDAASNRVQAVYGAGRGDARTVNTTYDALNRVHVITDQNTDFQVFYHYDAAGNRVREVQPNYGYIDKDFDALGRPLAIEGYVPGGNTTYYDYDLNYDAFGNLQRQEEHYAAGQLGNRTVSLSYDDANHLTSEAIVTGNTTVTSNFTYGQSFHNVTVNQDKIISKVVTQTVGNATSTLANITYAYSAKFTPQGITYNLSGNHSLIVTYENDVWGRVSERDVRPLDSYSTDIAYRTLFYFDDTNHLAGVVTGITTNAGTPHADTIYAYDYRGRRVFAKESSFNKTLTAFNFTKDLQRVTIFSGGTAEREYTNSVSLGAGNSIAAAALWTPANTTLAPAAEYIHGTDMGGGVGGVAYSLHAGVPSYYHYDGRGDVVAETTGGNGALLYQAAYTAFGGHHPSLPTDFTTTSLQFISGNAPAGTQDYGAQEWTASGANTDRYRKNTKEENNTGLINEGQRYFNPELMCFMSPDPLGTVDGLNVFSYVNQNPWTKFDPEGLYAESGHYYTTYAVARAAGLSPEKAFALAYYSQVPDEVNRYDAAKMGEKHYLVRAGVGLVLAGPIGAIIGALTPDKNMEGVQRDIHFLRGSNNAEIIKARRNITSAIQNGVFKSDAEMGFAIHTLGDAYAHTIVDKNGNERGYETGPGHLMDYNAPDQITSSPTSTAKYVKYVNQLYTALGGKGDPAQNADMQELVKTASSIPVPKGPDEDDSVASGIMRDYLTKKYDDSNLKGYDPLPENSTKNPANLPVPDEKSVGQYESKMEKIITQ